MGRRAHCLAVVGANPAGVQAVCQDRRRFALPGLVSARLQRGQLARVPLVQVSFQLGRLILHAPCCAESALHKPEQRRRVPELGLGWGCEATFRFLPSLFIASLCAFSSCSTSSVSRGSSSTCRAHTVTWEQFGQLQQRPGRAPASAAAPAGRASRPQGLQGCPRPRG